MSKWRPEGWETIRDKTYNHTRAGQSFNRIIAYCGVNELLLLEAGADAMLEAICEKIEKVENPYPITTRYDDPRYMDRLAHECFEQCRQKILSKVK